MADVICFYQDVKDKISQIEGFDYRSAVLQLHKTYKQFNSDSFTLVTEYDTATFEEKFDQYLVIDLPNNSLMENVCVANAHAVWKNPGRYVMCGCDHLINGNLDQMFDGTFDLGIMLVKEKVNNTVVLVDSDLHNHRFIDEFFHARVKVFEQLSSKMKRWGGDQYAIQRLLEEEGVLPEIKNKDRIYEWNGLRIKLFDYNTNGITGVSKSGPAFDTNAVFVDFKGPKRKRFFDQVYTYITLRGSRPKS